MIEQAAAVLNEHCLCGRTHPCELHDLEAIARRLRPAPEVQLTLFVQEAT